MVPQAEIFGVSISEPMTMATDYMITVATFWFAAQLLLTQANRAQLSRLSWGIAFIFLGVGAFFGGPVTALQPNWIKTGSITW